MLDLAIVLVAGVVLFGAVLIFAFDRLGERIVDRLLSWPDQHEGPFE